MSHSVLPPADLALARRLERAEATANAAFVEARTRVAPEVGASWIEVAGVYAMFDGVGSPLTQTFGLGLFDPFLAPEFERVEAFFVSRGAAIAHEVSSFTPETTQQLLAERGYVAIEHSTVLLRSSAADGVASVPGITVRAITSSESDLWAQISAQGWSSEGAELADFVESFGRITAQARGVHCFLAEVSGRPIAAAALHLANGVALLAGASTIPAARRRGAQQALLQARLAFAAAHGIELAMVVTQPGSASQRNAERQGFQPMYSRTKWERVVR
jgi:GNAT superfamily N-acetyltransferase